MIKFNNVHLRYVFNKQRILASILYLLGNASFNTGVSCERCWLLLCVTTRIRNHPTPQKINKNNTWQWHLQKLDKYPYPQKNTRCPVMPIFIHTVVQSNRVSVEISNHTNSCLVRFQLLERSLLAFSMIDFVLHHHKNTCLFCLLSWCKHFNNLLLFISQHSKKNIKRWKNPFK